MTPQKRTGNSKPRKQTSGRFNKAKPNPELAKRFKPLRNRPREYLDLETGARLSNRQYKKAVLTGGKSLEQYRKERAARGISSHTERYTKLVQERADYLKRQGVKLTKGAVRTSPEMKQLVKDLRSREGKFKKGKRTLYSANSRKARALVQLGLRDESWTFAVGETPK